MIYENMRKRRSIRRFKKDVPTNNMIEQLVKAASLAPSPSNKQSWRFIVTLNPAVIQSACAAVDIERKKLIPMVEEGFRTGFAEYSQNFLAFQQAPVLVVPIYRSLPMLSQILSRDDKIDITDSVEQLEKNSALISISCAIQNMLLMAENIGLGACCMTGPLIAVDQIKKIFKIREGWEPAAFLAVGYADEQPLMPERKSVHSILKWFE